MSGILLVAATEAELAGHDGLVCGVGPVEAAAATARALALDRPAAVLHVGIAGGRGLEPGTLVAGAEAVYLDLSAAVPVVTRAAADPALLAAVCAALPDVEPLPIATSAAVGAGTLSAEGMEGFAVLRACELAGVPAVEVRAISNEIGEDDRGHWRIPEALDALRDALPLLLEAMSAAGRR